MVQRMQAAAAAHHQQQQQQLNMDLHRISSPPPEGGPMDRNQSRFSGSGVTDPNLSQLSRISSNGSQATSSSDISPPGPASARVDLLTSTPNKVEHRGRWIEPSDRWYQEDQPKYAVPHQHNRYVLGCFISLLALFFTVVFVSLVHSPFMHV
jgi:hypothetical protein